MSLTDNIDNIAGPSSYDPQLNHNAMDPVGTPTTSDKKRYEFVILSDLLILPPAAATLGLVIGMTRGGRKARLRFLAENAHRQPRTYQGWVSYVGSVPDLVADLVVFLHKDAELQDLPGGLEVRRQAGFRTWWSHSGIRMSSGIRRVPSGRSTGASETLAPARESGRMAHKGRMAAGRRAVVGRSSCGNPTWSDDGSCV
jgi:hypothetical protein